MTSLSESLIWRAPSCLQTKQENLQEHVCSSFAYYLLYHLKIEFAAFYQLASLDVSGICAELSVFPQPHAWWITARKNEKTRWIDR